MVGVDQLQPMNKPTVRCCRCGAMGSLKLAGEEFVCRKADHCEQRQALVRVRPKKSLRGRVG